MTLLVPVLVAAAIALFPEDSPFLPLAFGAIVFVVLTHRGD